MHSIIISLTIILLWSTTVSTTGAQAVDVTDFPEPARVIIENTRPLEHPRGDRLPLLLWPAHGAVVEDAALQERIVRALDERGVAVIASWSYEESNPALGQKSLADSLRVAEIQKKLGMPVCVNANAIMYGFFTNEPDTSHIDENGDPIRDKSIPGRTGCPFRMDHRYGPMRKKVEFFVSAYREAGVPLDFVYGDWEIDGPLEINDAWDAAKRCVACRENISGLDRFENFMEAVRKKRSEATRLCYSEPILAAYPKVLVGNYAVYPHDGNRYWFDYFETFVPHHPHWMDRRAPCRRWYDEFPLTGYTFAMPVVYPWARTWGWYDFENGDYRWFYNMLLAATNAGKHTRPGVPVIPFVHWHTVFEPDPGDKTIRQMSPWAYQELLWHMLLRGHDTFFLWCRTEENPREVALLHGTWAQSLTYADWLDHGTPISFDVPTEPGTVVSGLRMGDRVIVRRTDFDDSDANPVTISVDGRQLVVPVAAGAMQVVELK
jgi:hypothetical protein